MYIQVLTSKNPKCIFKYFKEPFVFFIKQTKLCEVTKDLFDLILVAVLITGGNGESTAELFLPSAGTSCVLPSLPDNRALHTVDNNIICGGFHTNDTCLKWSPDTGTWEELTTLEVKRSEHVSWTPGTDIGTYLMGGWDSRRTTTLIKPDGTQEPGFPLKYDI